MELKSNFQLQTLVFILVQFSVNAGSQVPRPRGVALSRAPLYRPDVDFRCFDQSKTIPFLQVNDDYCDCADGSDEPGTAACPNGVFHCTNAGHRPFNIATSRVNDGVCDCCDGSDEYKGATCSNVCIELGRHAREEAQRVAELVKAGKEIKVELSQKGKQLRQEKQNKLSELQKNRVEAEKIKNENKAIKEEIEVREGAALEHYRKLEEEARQKQAEIEAEKKRQEAAEHFKWLDSNQDGVVDIAELQVRQQLDKDKNGEVSIEEAKYYLNNEDSVDIEAFTANAWPNIAPALLLDAGLYQPPSEGVGEVEDVSPDADAHHDPDEAPEEDDEEEEEEEETEEEAPAATPPPPAPQYDAETQALIDQATAARRQFDEADRAVGAIDDEIRQIDEYVAKDFGPDEEFASLEGECFEHHDREYVYKLCPFRHTVQTPKAGGSETRLGAWGRWDGGEADKYAAMMYEKGQACWNGPQRSTRVRVTCGVESQVIGVSEPNRCEYLFEFTTPAACRDATVEDPNVDYHDEL